MIIIDEHDSEKRKWLNALPISSTTDELNIQVNDKFDLLTIIEQEGIVCLKITIDEML